MIQNRLIVDMARRTMIMAGVAGTVSQLTGGKFANGAMTGAFIYMFNHMAGYMKRALYGNQTSYQRQKNAEKMFDTASMAGAGITFLGKQLKNPLLIEVGLGVEVGGTVMKYLVTPDKIKDYELFNEILPLPLQVTPAE